MSEWKRDQNGRLYREFGENCREYAQDMRFSSQYGRKPQPMKEAKPVPSRRCPFKSVVNNKCVGDGCALFVEGACILSKVSDQKPARNTAGLRCPINKEARPCSADCAVYNGGCSLTAITGRK